MYKRASGGFPRFGRNKFTPGRSITGVSQQPVYIKQETVSDVKSQRQDKCQNCGNWLKQNHREHCHAKNIIYNNCSGRGHFAEQCKKATVIQVDGSVITQYEMNVMQKWDIEKTQRRIRCVRSKDSGISGDVRIVSY